MLVSNQLYASNEKITLLPYSLETIPKNIISLKQPQTFQRFLPYLSLMFIIHSDAYHILGLYLGIEYINVKKSYLQE